MEDINIKELGIAFRLVGFNFEDQHLDLFKEIITAMKRMPEIGIKEIAEIEAKIENKYQKTTH